MNYPNHPHSRSPVVLSLKSLRRFIAAFADRQSISAWLNRRGSAASQNANIGSTGAIGFEQPAAINSGRQVSVRNFVNFIVAFHFVPQKNNSGLLSA